MIRADNSFLRSKFARRIFLLFVLAAIIPVAAIALLSFTQVSTQLREEAYGHAHIVCKAVGMELLRRLLKAQDELESIGQRLQPSPTQGQPPSFGAGNEEAPDLSALAFRANSGGIIKIQGVIGPWPSFSEGEERQLLGGKTVLQLRNNNTGASDLLMISLVKHDNAPQGILVGMVRPKFLWAVLDILPPSTDLLIQDPAGTELLGSRPVLHVALKSQNLTAISGHFKWRDRRQTNLASYWTLFTDPNFSIPDLVVVVSQPESVALAAITKFAMTYAPILLLMVLVSSFVVAKQIRKRLVPLTTLGEATRRIAKGDFGGHIEIDSDDEFAALGDEVNVMADRLDAQFTSLSTISEIDRLILSSFDARFIISTVLGRAGELTPCSAAALLQLDEDGLGGGTVTIRRNAAGAALEEKQVQLSHEELRQLQSDAAYLSFERGKPPPSYVAAWLPTEARSVVLFPTSIQHRPATVFMFAYATPLTDEDDWKALRKLADHVAVALSNAGWEERLYHQAHYDALTNLPNRALLKDRLEQALNRGLRNQTGVGVVFIDLDRFKLVNDTLGHAAGDQFLKKAAEVLQNSIRAVDTVVRFGGDEFVVILPDINLNDDVVFEIGAIADKILNAAHIELEIEQQSVRPGMSIGIALYPKDGHTPEELIKNADTAMYHAKATGRGRYEFFASELNAAAAHRLRMEQGLRQALANGEFVLHYQPKVDCKSEALVGAEALIRWRHPQGGIVPPLEFIAVAEETGLIQDIGMWVIKEVCRQLTVWRAAGMAPPRISVNVASRQFLNKDFAAAVAEILRQAQLESDILELEITESTVLKETQEVLGKLRAFREMGLRLSIDDFGTGYSSLSYLNKLPVHTLKIDRSFVNAMDEGDKTQAIVAATIVLAHKLGLEVVAEGVETEGQRQLLQTMQCDELQGYLISKPIAADEFAVRFLRKLSASDARDSDASHQHRNAG
jgi:diguanylate cyclase (GGDEF)-like protein